VGSESCIRWGPSPPVGSCNFERKEESIGTLCRELCKMVEPIDMPFGLWTRLGPWGYIAVDIGEQPGECNLTVHVRRPCKNGWTDRDAVRCVDSGGPMELLLMMARWRAATVPGMCSINQKCPFTDDVKARGRTKYINLQNSDCLWCSVLPEVVLSPVLLSMSFIIYFKFGAKISNH